MKSDKDSSINDPRYKDIEEELEREKARIAQEPAEKIAERETKELKQELAKDEEIARIQKELAELKEQLAEKEIEAEAGQRRRDETIARFEAKLARQQKTMGIILTWIGCALVLSAMRPWSMEGNSKWFTLTLLVAAIIITQLIAIWGKRISNLAAVLLISLNGVAFIIFALLPFGVGMPSVFNIIVGIAQIVGSIYILVVHQKVPLDN